jgi:hypothetical protein
MCVRILLILGAFCHIAMVEVVNLRLPVDLQFNPMGWYVQKTMRLRLEYARLFPGGSLCIKSEIAARVC